MIAEIGNMALHSSAPIVLPMSGFSKDVDSSRRETRADRPLFVTYSDFTAAEPDGSSKISTLR